MNRSVLPEAVVAGLEQAVNAVIALDPETGHRLSELQGRVIAIDLKGTGLTLFAAPTGRGLRLMARFEGEPDTRLAGTPLALLRLSGGQATQGLFSGEVTIEGDIETGQRFKRILDGLDVDWEEQLSKLTGDIVAHQVGNAFRGFSDWLRGSRDTLARNAGEYVQEELELVPGRGEVAHFMDEVDRLRADLDRLEARVDRLQ